jgi:hypothetical protein
VRNAHARQNTFFFNTTSHTAYPDFQTDARSSEATLPFPRVRPALEIKTTMRTCSFLWIICLLSCSGTCFDSVEIEKTGLNGTAAILHGKGLNRPDCRILIHAMKQKMQEPIDSEEERTVPAPESRTDVEPVNKTRSGQGHFWENETPKELQPP